MTTQSKAVAAQIKRRREALGISFDGFYDQLQMSARQGIWVENGQYGKNLTAMRITAGEFLLALENKAGIKFAVGDAIRVRREALGFSLDEFYDAMRIKPDRALKIEQGRCDATTDSLRGMIVRKLTALEADSFFTQRFIQPKQPDEGKTLPAARFLIVTADGRSVTKAGDDIRHRRMGLGVQRDEIPELTSNQVDNIEVGIYHADWVNFANKIWAYLDKIEAENMAHSAEIVDKGLLPFPPYTGANVPADVAQAAKEVATGGVNETLGRIGVKHVPVGALAKVTLDGVELLSQPEKFPTQKQCIEFADNLGQWMLKHDQNIVTIPLAEFYTMLHQQTGANRLNISMMEICFGEHVVGGAVAFLFSVGEHVVVVCKDSNFAPADLPE